MPLDTYSGLKTAISAWAMRTGDVQFEAQVPDFITLCERRINRTLRIAGMERLTEVALVDGVASLPDDYLEWRLFRSQSYPFGEIEFSTPGASADVSQAIGSSFGGSVDAVTLLYYAKVPPLSDAAPTNWLLEKAPDLYLYGSLLEAAPYMEEDNRAALWKTYYDTAISDLKSDDMGARYASGRVRVQGWRP